MATALTMTNVNCSWPLLAVVAGVTYNRPTALAAVTLLQLGLCRCASWGLHGFHGLHRCAVAFMAFTTFKNGSVLLQLGLCRCASWGLHGFHGLHRCAAAFMAFMTFINGSVLRSLLAFTAFLCFYILHGFHAVFIIAITGIHNTHGDIRMHMMPRRNTKLTMIWNM